MGSYSPLRSIFLRSEACWLAPAEWRGSIFAKRRQFFENHRYTHGKGGGACAACGYPTLMLSIEFDYCWTCHWEDDGSDDPCADMISHGNGGISLNQARHNVLKHGTMFHPTDSRWMHPSQYGRIFNPEAIKNQTRLYKLLDDLMKIQEVEKIERQWAYIDEHLKPDKPKAP